MTLDPLTLLLFILFIVVPLINGLLRGQQQRPPGRQPGHPGAPDAKADTSAGDDTFAKRLEEARRRVREAMGEEVGPAEASQRAEPRTVAGDRTPRTVAGDAPSRTVPGDRPLPTIKGDRPSPTVKGDRTPRTIAEPAQRPSAPAARPLGGSLETLTPLGEEGSLKRDTSPPMQVQRRLSTAQKLKPKELMRFDAKHVYQGMIWHQILSEPRAKRPYRRKTSRRLP
jgi:hypothetical protein